MQHAVLFDQTVVPVAELVTRARAINLTLNDLARDAGVNLQTVWRARKKGDCRVSTGSRLTAALVARERALLAHLERIHRARVDPRQLDLVDAIDRKGRAS